MSAEALKKQSIYQAEINTIITNFKKRSSSTYNAGYIQSRLDSLCKSFEAFVENHRNLTMIISENEKINVAYFTEDTFSKFEERFHDCRGVFLDLIEKIKLSQSSRTNVPQQDGVSADRRHEIKLPKIEIPKFSGDYKEWSAFRDLFENLVHSNNSLLNIQKMHYLKTYLTGEAASIIKHISVSSENYDSAWKSIHDRYDNKRILVNAHLRALMAQKILVTESSSGIKLILDTTREIMNALSNLKIDIGSWDPIVIYVITNKLDPETHRLWEQSLENPKDIPKLNAFYKFLEARFQSLEFLDSRPFNRANQQKAKSYLGVSDELAADILSCSICKGTHRVESCRRLIFASPQKRKEMVESCHLCYICLSENHNANQCKSNKMCKKCQARHHTLLHITKASPTKTNNSAKSSLLTTPVEQEEFEDAPCGSEQSIQDQQCSLTGNVSSENFVLLATALVKVENKFGTYDILRVLLDQGSHCSFITEHAAQLLKLKRNQTNTLVSGLGSIKAGICRSSVEITISPHFSSEFSLRVNVLVLEKLTGMIPSRKLDVTGFKFLNGLVLADPKYDQVGKIDILLGADAYADLILEGIVKGPVGTPVAQKTSLGWIISGPGNVKARESNVTSLHVQHIEADVDKSLRKFWELEEVNVDVSVSEEDRMCEEFFEKNVQRDESGRYVVALPLKNRILRNYSLNMGNSRKKAAARQLQMEKKFVKDRCLKEDYGRFMEEYEQLDHMSKTTDFNNSLISYLPHHAVRKSDSSTTKLRVVFDASSKTDSGISLNESMLVGPTIQDDLASILIRWRKHRVALSADIEKMYRQILVKPEDRDLQRILWRKDDSQQLEDFQLNTVTYGTSSAPYLAIRTLRQLAVDEASKFPIASKVVLSDFYVDDVMSGANNLNEAKILRDQLIQMLKAGGFILRKWVSNELGLLEDLAEDMLELKLPIALDAGDTVKSLGLRWNPIQDYFEFKVLPIQNNKIITKRIILSETARLFDPLGWLAPIVVVGKILMQDLWTAGTTWDEPVPELLGHRWNRFAENLPKIEQVKIPRWIGYGKNTHLQLHGFSDASEKAYAAVIYLRVISTEKDVKVTLIAAKTRVAPLRQVSLPRLELCGAVLLAKLLKKIKQALHMENVETILWTDSQITLAWIRASPQKWKTFVANRVSQIQETTSSDQWRFVPGEENPADCASRGLIPQDLLDHHLWWAGPTWLKNNDELFNQPVGKYDTNVEVRGPICLLAQKDKFNIENRYSSISKLSRITALCLRFAYNIWNKNDRKTGPLSVVDVKKGLEIWIRNNQKMAFAAEIAKLETKSKISSKSKILSLNPFLDAEGILRVGGRLEFAQLEFNNKHPIIVPNKTHLSKLLIGEAHIRTLHGGNQLTLQYLRQQYWIPNVRQSIKAFIHSCVVCHRFKAKMANQQMGQIPKPRLTAARAFTQCGVDYAGPLDVKLSKGRGYKTTKGYIAVFICMATKAVHLEAVSDLSSQAFLAAFHRLSSRRGQPAHMYSDNGTNFVGAEKLFRKQLLGFIDSYKSEFIDTLTELGTQWHRIPPASPHFGGLWEAGVKSMKHHLRRIVGNSILTIEELSTVVAQIEASLNSRPLCPLTDDPGDLEALTPGHFLIGTPLLAPPVADLTSVPMNRLDRWQLIQRLHQNFWQRWSTEYITRLQHRPKWARPQTNLKINDLVLIKEDNIPPSKWMLGRIIQTHNGNDGLVRVVTLKTKSGLIKRPVVKLSLLPVKENDDSVQ